jgi:NTE family protein
MRFIWLFFLVIVMGPYGCFAFQQPNPRPKIGVALQGGGAKGMAHIGTLQWLEDHHIPIDYIEIGRNAGVPGEWSLFGCAL